MNIFILQIMKKWTIFFLFNIRYHISCKVIQVIRTSSSITIYIIILSTTTIYIVSTYYLYKLGNGSRVRISILIFKFVKIFRNWNRTRIFHSDEMCPCQKKRWTNNLWIQGKITNTDNYKALTIKTYFSKWKKIYEKNWPTHRSFSLVGLSLG